MDTIPNMSADDSGDVFLRHRGAVVDALLSDPSFGPSAGVAPGESVVQAPVTSAGVISAPDLVPGESLIEPEPAAATADRRRANGAPKASDRILALLNGEPPDESPGMEFSSEFTEMAASRLRSSPTATESVHPGEESEQASSHAAPRSAGAAPLTAILTQIRRPRVALAIVAVLAVLLVVVLVTTGGDKSKSDQAVVVTPVAAGTLTPSKTDPAASASGTIAVKSAKAHCPSGSTDGMDAFAGQPGKAWTCVRAFKVDGQVLTINLGKTYQVDSIGIVPGWDSTGSDGVDQWTKYRTVSRASYRFNDTDATTYTQQTMDQRSLVVTKINPPVSASKITLTVLASKGDSSINSIAISSIVITGH